jgi:hypothetical protein
MDHWSNLRGGKGTKALAFMGFLVLLFSIVFFSKAMLVTPIAIGLAVIPYVFFKVDYCQRMIAAQKDILDAIQKHDRKD